MYLFDKQSKVIRNINISLKSKNKNTDKDNLASTQLLDIIIHYTNRIKLKFV